MTNKTVPTDVPVETFLETVEPARLADARTILQMMEEASGEPPVMWGPSIVGFGQVRMTYDSGRELDWMLVGFSPRKREQVLYVMQGFDGFDGLLARLGPHRHGKSCLYVKNLAKVDLGVLRELIEASVHHMRQEHG